MGKSVVNEKDTMEQQKTYNLSDNWVVTINIQLNKHKSFPLTLQTKV